jgi:hypothetical protein
VIGGTNPKDRKAATIAPAALLLLATFLVFSRIPWHGFLINWDDPAYVTANEAVKGLSLPHLRAAFTTFYVGNFAPVQIISYMLDYELWGMRAGGFLFSNILIHAANGVLFYFLLVRIQGRKLWGFAGAFLFLVHPVQVESVAWVSERKNLLAMFFFLVSFHLYIRYRAKGWRGGWTLYAFSIATFVLALFSKSVVVILPLALGMYDLCFNRQEGQREWLLLNKLPYIVAAGGVAMLTLLSQIPEFGSGGITDFHGGGPWATFLTMLPVLVRYLTMLVCPVHLSAVYAPPIKTAIDPAVVGSALLIVLLTVAGVSLYRHRRELFFWFSLFFIGLLPVSQVVPLVTLMNDRYLYFPLLGAAGLFAGLGCLACEASTGRWNIFVGTAIVTLLLPLPLISFNRAEVWKDSASLFRDATAKDPGNAMAWWGLGNAYLLQRELGPARSSLLTALKFGESPDVLYNLACVEAVSGNRSDALRLLRRAIKAGYQHLENIKTDHELDSLRPLPEFRRLVAQYYILRFLRPSDVHVQK